MSVVGLSRWHFGGLGLLDDLSFELWVGIQNLTGKLQGMNESDISLECRVYRV